MQEHTEKRLVSVPKYAAYIGSSVRTGWTHVYNGTVPSIRIGGLVRVDLNAVDLILEAKTTKVREVA